MLLRVPLIEFYYLESYKYRALYWINWTDLTFAHFLAIRFCTFNARRGPNESSKSIELLIIVEPRGERQRETENRDRVIRYCTATTYFNVIILNFSRSPISLTLVGIHWDLLWLKHDLLLLLIVYINTHTHIRRLTPERYDFLKITRQINNLCKNGRKRRKNNGDDGNLMIMIKQVYTRNLWKETTPNHPPTTGETKHESLLIR